MSSTRYKRSRDKKSYSGPLRQKYLGVVLSGKKTVNIDNVYGVYFSSDGTMLDDKRIDLDKNDNVKMEKDTR